MLLDFVSENSLATAILAAFLVLEKNQNGKHHDLSKLPGPKTMHIVGGSYEIGSAR